MKKLSRSRSISLVLAMKLIAELFKSAVLLTAVSSSATSCRLCDRMTAAQCASQPLTTCSEKHSLTEDDRVCMLTYEQRMTRNGPTTLYTSRCVHENVCESSIRLGFYTQICVFLRDKCKTLKTKLYIKPTVAQSLSILTTGQ